MTEADKSLIEQLRKLADIHGSSEKLPPQEIKRLQSIAADLYLKHANRTITLTNEEFQDVVNILKLK